MAERRDAASELVSAACGVVFVVYVLDLWTGGGIVRGIRDWFSHPEASGPTASPRYHAPSGIIAEAVSITKEAISREGNAT